MPISRGALKKLSEARGETQEASRGPFMRDGHSDWCAVILEWTQIHSWLCKISDCVPASVEIGSKFIAYHPGVINMLDGKKIIVVLPAYNAAKTLEKTYNEIPHQMVDEVILVDDCSRDEPVAEVRCLGSRQRAPKISKGCWAKKFWQMFQRRGKII